MAMLADQIMRASLDDIIFDGRNKSYGAYALRTFYERHLMQAMVIAISMFLLAIFSPRLLEAWFPQEKVVVVPAKEPTVTMPRNPPEIEMPQLPAAVAEPAAQPPALTTPVIVADPHETTTMAPVDVLLNTPVASTGSGTGTDGVEGTEGTGTSDVVTDPTAGLADPDMIHTVVQETPEYPGGIGALMNFIRSNIRYPREAYDARVHGRVFVSFVLNKQGEVTDVQIEKGLGFGLDEEAIRVVKLLKGFTPAKQAGMPVNYRYVLPIKFKP